MKVSVFNVIKELASKRPLFHNEKDFQFEFALLMQQLGYKIRLETYVEQGNNKTVEIILNPV